MRSLDSARHLVRLGLHLVPIPRGEKMSRKKGWHHSGNLASTPEQVETLFGQRELNIGVCLGPSGLISLDVDDRLEAERLLAAENIDLTAFAGSHPHPIKARGERYWYRLPGAFVYGGVRQWRGTGPEGKMLMAFELRTGDAAQDVAPGSLHPDGMEYVWSRGAPACREDLPECPPELLALYQRGQGKRRALAPVKPPLFPPSPTSARPVPVGSDPVKTGRRCTSPRLGQLDADDVRAWINAHHDMAVLMLQYGYRIAGRRIQCPFPGHADSNPSASYSAEHVYCHVCRKPLDIVGLVMLREEMSYRAAARFLGYVPPTRLREIRQDVAVQSRVHVRAARPVCPPQDYADLVAYAGQALLSGCTATARQARAYLRVRGFSDEDLIRLNLGITDEMTPTALLPMCWTSGGCLTTFRSWQERWRGRIIIPDRRIEGISVKGRDLLSRDPSQKYMLAAGFPPGVFNAQQAAQQHGPLLLVEGEMDAMTAMTRLTDHAVAGVPGVAVLGDCDAELLGVRGRRVLVMLDADVDMLRACHLGPQSSAQGGAVSTVSTLRAAGADVWLVPALPGHSDLNAAAQALDRAVFTDVLQRHLSEFARPLVRSRMMH